MNPFTLESGQVFLCILYHPIALIGSVLGLKTWGKKVLIFTPKKGTLAMKKYVDGDHVDTLLLCNLRKFSQKHKLSS